MKRPFLLLQPAASLQVGQTIRLDEEIMQVVAATEAGLEVERGSAGAVRLPHSKGTERQLGLSA